MVETTRRIVEGVTCFTLAYKAIWLSLVAGLVFIHDKASSIWLTVKLNAAYVSITDD